MRAPGPDAQEKEGILRAAVVRGFDEDISINRGRYEEPALPDAEPVAAR
ncbi:MULTISPECIES: hypothetical protein [Bacteria]